jgi:hypothetical protein
LDEQRSLNVDFNINTWSFASGWDPLTNDQGLFASFEDGLSEARLEDGLSEARLEANEMVSEPNGVANVSANASNAGQANRRNSNTNSSPSFNVPNVNSNAYNNANYQVPNNNTNPNNIYSNFAANINPTHSAKVSHFAPIQSVTTSVGTFSTFALPHSAPNALGLSLQAMSLSSPNPNPNPNPNPSHFPANAASSIHIPLNKMSGQKSGHSTHSPRNQSPRSPIVR